VHDSKGCTLLHMASRMGYFEIVWQLLQANADAGLENMCGWTAIQLAMKDGHNDAVELLSEY
jgi:ankyrin repeat protein